MGMASRRKRERRNLEISMDFLSSGNWEKIFEKKAKEFKEELNEGEIIRVRSALGMPPYGIYRFEGMKYGMFHLSAGEIKLGVMPKAIEVLERKLPEPQSWLPSEIALIRAQLEICDCKDCRENLRKCEKRLAEWELSHGAGQMH